MLMKESIDRITRMLRLTVTGFEQGWDIELSDSNRIDEFINIYESANLGPSDKTALMALLLASINSYIEIEREVPRDWQTVLRLLTTDSEIHADVIRYWEREGVDDPDEFFPLTPYIRCMSI